MTKDMFAGRCV